MIVRYTNAPATGHEAIRDRFRAIGKYMQATDYDGEIAVDCSDDLTAGEQTTEIAWGAGEGYTVEVTQ